jgi:hypothetical protein
MLAHASNAGYMLAKSTTEIYEIVFGGQRRHLRHQDKHKIGVFIGGQGKPLSLRAQ